MARRRRAAAPRRPRPTPPRRAEEARRPVGALKRQLKGGTTPSSKVMARGDELKREQQALADEQADAEAEAEQIMLQLPAIPDPTWPVGEDAEENDVVRTWADPSAPAAAAGGGRKDHVALGTALGILDFDRGVKLAGSRSYVLRGAGALLYWAVLRFAQDVLVAARLRAVRRARARHRAVHDRHRLLPRRPRPGVRHAGQHRPRRHQRSAARQLPRRRDPRRKRPAEEVLRH